MTETTILARLGLANGRRRERTLGDGAVFGCIQQVRDGKMFWNIHGGSAATACDHPSRTTIVLAARRESDGAIVVDVAACSALLPSPGRAWRELRPWRPGTVNFPDKLQAWASDPRRIVVR